MNYFIHDERDLSPAYVRKCKKFLRSLKGLITKKEAAELFKPQAASAKLQEGIDYEVDNIDDYIKRVKLQAASNKRQAPSNKRQASSTKLK